MISPRKGPILPMSADFWWPAQAKFHTRSIFVNGWALQVLHCRQLTHLVWPMMSQCKRIEQHRSTIQLHILAPSFQGRSIVATSPPKITPYRLLGQVPTIPSLGSHFAWKPYYMSGVPRELTKNYLHVKKDAVLIKPTL
jgi:hypothetical protein